MPLLTFKNKQDLEESALAIRSLLQGWGLQTGEWMIGKQMGFFLGGVILNPKIIKRDTNVYILYKKLPWPCQPEGRMVFPPKGSIYAKQYYETQEKYQLGIDLMPIPDKQLKSGYITQKKLLVNVASQKINIESPAKFVEREEILAEFYQNRSNQEIRDFYYCDRTRYLGWTTLFKRVGVGLKSKSLIKRLAKVTTDYKSFIKRAYPEFFDKKLMHGGQNSKLLHGQIAYFKEATLTGKVAIYDSKIKYQPTPEKSIFVFSHFYPADTVVLPLAKAIVTQGGGLLCHAAIVTREEQVPCLVGVCGLMRSIKNGQKITINFKEGTIKL